MGRYRGSDDDPGWIARRFAELEKLIGENDAARRLASSTIKAAKGITLVDDLGAKLVQFGLTGLTIFTGGKVIVYGTGVIGSMDNGAFGMATLDGSGNITFPKTRMTTGGFLADSGANGYVIMGVDSATGDAVITAGSGKLLHVPYITTSSAANTRMELDGSLRLVSSSRRFKQDIRDAIVDPAAVLRMVGRTWRDRVDVAEDSATTKRYVGFIAEELHDLGLTDFVEYDKQGEPYAIAYDRLAVALIAVAKDLDARLKALENAGGISIGVKVK